MIVIMEKTMTNKSKTIIEKFQTGVQVINHIHSTYNEEIFKGKEPKYQKEREISRATMYYSADTNIDLPHWKCLCCCFQKCTPLHLTDEETSTSPFISYIKYYFYKNITMCSVHGLHSLGEHK